MRCNSIRLLAWLAATTLVACGYTDPGSGSKTLNVEANATYSVGDGNRTRVTITVTDAEGLAIETAEVQVRDGKTDEVVSVPHDTGGTYRATLSSYRRRLELQVQAADAGLTAKLEGPGLHRITDPKAGAIDRTSLGSNLHIQWDTDDGIRADEVRMRIAGPREVERAISNDGGSYDGVTISDIPAAGDYRLTVERSNSVELAGGLPGSVFTLTYAVDTDFTLTN